MISAHYTPDKGLVESRDGEGVDFGGSTVSGHFVGPLSGSLTRLEDGTSYIIAGVNALVSSASNGAIAVTGKGRGNIVFVDDVHGDDGTGMNSWGPFKTINAAVDYVSSSALMGVTIHVQPGTYNLSKGIVIPNTCAIRGVDLQTISFQMLNVTSSTTLITMGENTRLDNVALKLTSTTDGVNLFGIALPGMTAVTSKCRTLTLTLDNRTVSKTSTSNVVGVVSNGSGSLGEESFTYNFLRASTMKVYSNGAGLKTGICMPSGSIWSELSTRDINIYVAEPPDIDSIGTYVGVRCANSGSYVQLRGTCISGPKHGSIETNQSVRIASKVNVTTTGEQTLQGVSLISGDRVLLTSQTSAIDNGIWVVDAGAWSRAADFDVGHNAACAWVHSTEGTFASLRWTCYSNPAIVGTDALNWTTTYTAMDIKVPVWARYTGGVPSGSLAAQGRYTPTAGDRIFLDNATDPKNNGTWLYGTGDWTRSADFLAGFASLDAHVCVIGGTYEATQWHCITTGTVGTDELTFRQEFFGSDVLQLEPYEANLGKGVEIGPGCDLVHSSAGSKPFTMFTYPSVITYGLQGNVANGTSYLWPGMQTASDATQVFHRLLQKTIVAGMYVNCRIAAGARTVKLTVLKSVSGVAGRGVPTCLSVTLTNGFLAGQNFNNSVTFEQGTYIGMMIESDGPVNNMDLTVQVATF